MFLRNNKKLMKSIDNLQRNNQIRLEILFNLAFRYHDSKAEEVLKRDLTFFYRTGIIDLIRKLKNDRFYEIFNIDELTHLIFYSKSPITLNFLRILRDAEIPVDYLISKLEEFKTINNKAMKSVLIYEYLIFGNEYISENIEDIKEEFADNRLSEIFNFYLEP